MQSTLSDYAKLKAEYKRRKELYCSIYITKETRDRYKTYKRKLGPRATYDMALSQTLMEVERGATIPFANYDICFKDDRPIIITGESGSGKSTTVNNMLLQWPRNVFALDVSGKDYLGLRAIDLGDFFKIKWNEQQLRVRVISNPNVEASKGEAAGIFSWLNFIKGTGDLKQWV